MRVHLTKRGPVWHCYYREKGRRVRKSLGVENRKVAEQLRRELELRLNGGDEADADLVEIRAFKEEYRAFSMARKRPKSHKTDMARLDDFLDSVDAVFLEDLTTADASRYLAEKALKGASPTTTLRYREVLHAFFNHAKRLGYVRENPIAIIPRPRLPIRDPRFLSLDQIDELLKVVKRDRIAPLVVTLVYAGLRRSEACWLTKDDVHLDSEPPVMRVCAKQVGGESWQPKTGRDRTIPISTKLRAHLKKVKKDRSPWLFPSLQGCRWDPDNLSQRFRALVKKAGLPWNFLDLRHTFGSHLARNGVSLLKIAKLMGNSPEIARRHYINLIPEELSADVEF